MSRNLSGFFRKITAVLLIFLCLLWIGELIKICQWKIEASYIPWSHWTIFLSISFLMILSYIIAFKTSDRILANIYLSTGSIIVFVLFAEIITKIFVKHGLVEPFSRPPHLQDNLRGTLNPMWGSMPTLEPNYQGKTYGHPVYINTYGFRGEDFALLKGENVFRIIVLGDSLTFGQGVRDEAVYTSVLKNMLQSKYPNRKIEVVNLGICGYSAVEEAKLLENIASRVNFDLILIGFCVNDVKEGPQTPNRWRGQLPIPPKAKRMILERMVLARLLQERYDRLLINLGIRDTFVSSVGPCYNKESMAWKKFMAAYKRIFRLNAKLNLPKPMVGLLLQSLGKNMMNYLNQVEAALGEMGFVTINYLEAFKKHGKQPLAVSKWESHPNEFTHRAYAQGFYDAIVGLEIIRNSQ